MKTRFNQAFRLCKVISERKRTYIRSHGISSKPQTDVRRQSGDRGFSGLQKGQGGHHICDQQTIFFAVTRLDLPCFPSSSAI